MTKLSLTLPRRALASAVALTLISGTMPAHFAFAEAANSSTGGSASQPSSASTNVSNGESDSGSASGGTSSGNASSGSSGESSSQGGSSTTGDSASSTASNSGATQSADAAEEDPYASTYKATNAIAGESQGTLATLSAESAEEAACLQVSAAWEAADTVVLVPANAGAEVVSAVALAGAMGCPVLFLNDGQIGTATRNEIAALGAKKAIIVASASVDTHAAESMLTDPEGWQARIAQAAVNVSAAEKSQEGQGDESSSDVEETALALQPMEVERIKGASAADISVAVARYGLASGLWDLHSAVIANGSDTACARAVAAEAYRLAQPVILTSGEGRIPTVQGSLTAKGADSTYAGSVGVGAGLLDDLENVLVVAAEGRVPDASIDSLKLMSADPSKRLRVQRLTGADAYAVNARVESWYGSTHPLSWDSSIVINADQASSVTAGIMAARLGVASLATSYDALSASACLPADQSATTVTLSGEGSVVSSATRNALRARLGFYDVSVVDAGTTLDAAANREVDNSRNAEGVTQKAKDDVLEAMDPGRASRDSAYYYEFALLDQGYSGVVTADQINAFIDDIAGSYEASYGTTSQMRGTGQAFIDAAKEYGVNEVYLLANAIHESACGCSQLASGSSGAYNFFGIAAYDSNPSEGSSYASAQGWDSPENAVKGGGKWISENYLHAATGQNTLYLMRFNVPSASHQYATGLGWNTSIAKMMSRFYEFAGITLEHTGLNFKVMRYTDLEQ